MNLLRKVFARATALALIGSVLPVSFGIIYVSLILGESITSGVASGASLASTSIAVALVLMQEHKIVETKIGTLLTAAAMLDDVFSLVLIAVVSSLGSFRPSDPGTPSALNPTEPASLSHAQSSLAIAIVRPIAASVAVLIVGTFAAKMFQTFLHRLFFVPMDPPTQVDGPACGRRTFCCCVLKIRQWWHSVLLSPYKHEVFLCIMCAYSFAWSITSVLAGSSYLIGAFVAGLAFGSDPSQSSPSAGFVLSRKGLERLDPLKWFLLAVFFGSIGFSLRVNVLFEPWALLYGALIYTIIMVGAKMLAGLLAKPLSWASFLTVGTAMVGRGELGLYLSEQAQRAGVVSPRIFAATTWALLLNTFLSPILFALVVKKYPTGQNANRLESDSHEQIEVDTYG
eukprot:TRINITY_DN3502_c0_g1_i1.p1 TRINITY_DN3502_c0_g1~~TRINITY_DN3502_c0_g1_i1.p1  ORF type:complete len:398 (+),score=42.56 TRINITY_DN3502_c0_g1_i1:817-2010(+)